jgi:hypothetical protein
MLARTVLRPSVQAALTTQRYSRRFGDLDPTALDAELSAQISAINGGDMHRAEGMLVAQAHTLEAIFHELVKVASDNLGTNLGGAETCLRLGLKAQAQCRATLETLAALKNPPSVAFVRQANIAHGPQQVNNGTQSKPDASRARDSENQPNKLLEKQREEWLDNRTVQATVGADSAMATVGARDRSEDGSR